MLTLAALEFGVVAATGGDWMLLYRRLLPGFVYVALAVDGPVLACFRWGVGWGRWLRAFAIAAAAAYIPISWPDSRAGRDLAVQTLKNDIARASMLADVWASGVRSVATFDIGLVGYLLPKLEVVDVAGLTDAEVAGVEGKHYYKFVSSEYLARRNPDALLLTGRKPPTQDPATGAVGVTAYYPAEQHLLTLETTERNYAYAYTYQLNPVYFIHLFRRKTAVPASAPPDSSAGTPDSSAGTPGSDTPEQPGAPE
jgi:hypothetical protein